MSQKTIDKYLDLLQTRPHSFIQGQLEIILNRNTLIDFERKHQCELGLLYESSYHLLVKDLVSDGKKIFAYERIIKQHSNNSVVIIPIYQNSFVLLNQFRHSMRKKQLCFPRGFGEPDISVEANAIKELHEELGVDVHSCSVIGHVVADSGLCGEKANICLCKITKPLLKYNYEGINSIEIVDFKEMSSYIKTGKINDGFTLSAFSLYMTQKQFE